MKQILQLNPNGFYAHLEQLQTLLKEYNPTMLTLQGRKFKKHHHSTTQVEESSWQYQKNSTLPKEDHEKEGQITPASTLGKHNAETTRTPRAKGPQRAKSSEEPKIRKILPSKPLQRRPPKAKSEAWKDPKDLH